MRSWRNGGRCFGVYDNKRSCGCAPARLALARTDAQRRSRGPMPPVSRRQRSAGYWSWGVTGRFRAIGYETKSDSAVISEPRNLDPKKK